MAFFIVVMRAIIIFVLYFYCHFALKNTLVFSCTWRFWCDHSICFIHGTHTRNVPYMMWKLNAIDVITSLCTGKKWHHWIEIVCENKSYPLDSLMPCAFHVVFDGASVWLFVVWRKLRVDLSFFPLLLSPSRFYLAWVGHRVWICLTFNIRTCLLLEPAICMYLWIQIWWRESERAWVLGVEKSNAFYHYKMLCIFTYAPFTLKRFNILQNHLVFECEVAVRPFSFFWSITLWISLPLSSIRFIHSACFWLEKKRRCF